MVRVVAILLLLAMLAGCTPVRPVLDEVRPVAVIGFGSCANQNRPQPIWDAVLANAPDLFVLLGDNVYADTDNMAVLRAAYAQLAGQPGFQRLRMQVPVVATWDDHDYGFNDSGAEHIAKEGSKQVFLDFFGEPAQSDRRTRAGGIFTSYLLGEPGRHVQLILLDTRWDRSPLNRVSDAEYDARRQLNVGPYAASTDPDARLLGEEQWQWLADQLEQPADLRIIATSVPFLQEGTGWEIWANFPAERQRLLDLIDATEANGVLFITGDTHRAQFSRLAAGVPYPLWEINSSGLTENVDPARVAPDANRLGDYFVGDNFGLIRIDWTDPDPMITLEIRGEDNSLQLQHELRLSELHAPA